MLLVKKIVYAVILCFWYTSFIIFLESVLWGGTEGETESEADSMPSTGPNMGLDLTTWDHDLSQNLESDV